jgi:hypothetical protein
MGREQGGLKVGVFFLSLATILSFTFLLCFNFLKTSGCLWLCLAVGYECDFIKNIHLFLCNICI